MRRMLGDMGRGGYEATMTDFGTRLADETANHYAELRQRRVPRLPAAVMALVFHHVLCRSVMFDDRFSDVVGPMLRSVRERDEG